jgi:hypothetical protein
MNPGRELDALIAEKVMGLKPRFMLYSRITEGLLSCEQYEDLSEITGVIDNNPDCYSKQTPYPSYSTDIKAAYEMQDTLIAKSYYFRTHSNKNGWYVGIYKTGKRGLLSWAEASTIPHAICLAALKSLGVEV